MVCLGNICRSPMAEVLLRAELADIGLAERVSVESAGTGDWHIGDRMDRLASAELASRGFDGSGHRARQITPAWLDRFDLLLAMDASNLRNRQRMAAGRDGAAERIRLFLSFDPKAPPGAQVPDPYGGPAGQFTAVFDMLRSAASGLAEALAQMLAEHAGG
jgi:low molecular weight protein-tyrosine phosphatase